jgi:hypothetical protein
LAGTGARLVCAGAGDGVATGDTDSAAGAATVSSSAEVSVVATAVLLFDAPDVEDGSGVALLSGWGEAPGEAEALAATREELPATAAELALTAGLALAE